MSAMVESWMNELGKWKERVQARQKPLMPKSKQQGEPKEAKKALDNFSDSDDRDSSTLSESTVCLLMDRFAPL